MTNIKAYSSQNEERAGEVDPAGFPRFAVTVDIVALAVGPKGLELLLIDRDEAPFEGQPALPGGFVRADEDADAAAAREFEEEAGLTRSDLRGALLEQVAVFSSPGRDPRERQGAPADTYRIVSVAYLALSPVRPAPTAGGDARHARWVPVGELESLALAFDHAAIVARCLAAVRSRVQFTTAAAALAGAPDFTLGELQAAYEAVLDTRLDAPNFRRKVLATDGFVAPTGERRVGTGGGAPAAVYRVARPGNLSTPLIVDAPKGARRTRATRSER